MARQLRLVVLERQTLGREAEVTLPLMPEEEQAEVGLSLSVNRLLRGFQRLALA